jgi:type VI secretion system Hcp family effector
MQIRSLALGILASAVVSSAALADVITLQVPGIPGDAKFAASNGLPADSIKVLTVSGSAENPVAMSGSSGGGAGKVNFSRLSVVKKFGESSAPLFLQVARGLILPTVTVNFYRIKQGAPVKYYSITLQNVTVAGQTWVGNSNAVDSLDSENLEFVYSTITFQDVDSNTRACFDVQRNQTC